jgi:hypothetical protein
MNALLWTEQYRPKHLDDIIGQDAVKGFLKRIIAAGSATSAPHLILHGPPGTGKTSMAMSFAADMYPTVPFPAATMYLNASDERTMETVRDRIREFLRVHWVGVNRKIVIFDEVETMTEAAQLTLRSLMDEALMGDLEPPLFLFLCNTLSRIVPTVRSRALALFCGHLTAAQIRGLLSDIQTREGVSFELPTPLACLINRGDMRAFLQRAQQGQDANQWLPWIQRLFNAPIDRVGIVWEDGCAQAPLWLLLRHLLVFMYSLNIPTTALTPDVWREFLFVVIHPQNTVATVTAAWQTLRHALCSPNLTA